MTRRLKILAVMPRLVQSIGDGYAFPLGIAYISSSLKAAGFDVLTLNLNHYHGTIHQLLLSTIDQYHPDILCTGGLSFQYPTVRDIVDASKSINKGIVTIVGGGLITAEPTIAMQALDNADYGVIGEGEITICELVRALEMGDAPEKIAGLIYSRDGQYILTEPRKEIRDLDALPWPDYEGFEISKYLDLPSVSVNNILASRVLYICGSRSCPYNCTFCFHSTGRKYRQRSIESIMGEISFLHERFNLGLVCMSDELFARDKNRIQQFATKMRDLNLPWVGSFRVDDVNQEIIDILKDGKCASMSFGLESADDRILKSMRKHITVAQIECALKMVTDAGIPSAGNFIFGDVEESLETGRRTLDWWAKHTEYNIGLNLITTYPGSYIYKYACEKGIIKDRVQFLRDGCPQVNVSKLRDVEFGILVKEIFEAPYKYGKQVKDVHSYQVRTDGRLSIEGKCCKCSADNTWNNVKLFVGNSWLPCLSCGQKHNVPLPPELSEVLSMRISALLKNNAQIAIWGITNYSIHLLQGMPIFRNPGIIYIDNSSSKQMMSINEKKVYPPGILMEKTIPCVVVFYPNSYQQIASQIRKLYSSVSQIIDVCDLVEGVTFIRSGITSEMPPQ